MKSWIKKLFGLNAKSSGRGDVDIFCKVAEELTGKSVSSTTRSANDDVFFYGLVGVTGLVPIKSDKGMYYKNVYMSLNSEFLEGKKIVPCSREYNIIDSLNIGTVLEHKELKELINK